jgi:hypothetical protein
MAETTRSSGSGVKYAAAVEAEHVAPMVEDVSAEDGNEAVKEVRN